MTAILANNKPLEQALTLLKKIFAAGDNWNELLRRLPKLALLMVNMGF